MEKHFTPGPWSISWSTFNGQQDHGIYADGELDLKGHQIAIVNFYPTLSSKADEITGKANARLVCAAPDLYDALAAMVAKFEKWDESDSLTSVELQLLINGRNAIKKAQ